MTINSAFSVNGAVPTGAIALAPGALVTLQVLDLAGLNSIEWLVVGNDNHARVNPVITASGSPSGAIATFIMPVDMGDGLGQAYRIQCVGMSGGRASVTTTAIIGVVNPAGIVPLVYGEDLDRDPIYGWTETLNTVLANAVGVTGATGATGATGPSGTFGGAVASTQVAYGTGPTALAGSAALTFDNGTDKSLQLLASTTHVAQFAVFDSSFARRVQMRADPTNGAWVLAEGLAMLEGATPPTVTVLGSYSQFVVDSTKRPVFIDSAGNSKILAPFPEITETLATSNATPTTLVSVATIADNTIAIVKARVVAHTPGSGSTTMVYECTQAFKKINGGSPAAYGALSVALSVKDDATWGDPSFAIVGDVLSLTVTGKAATTIQWSGDVWCTQVALP